MDRKQFVTALKALAEPVLDAAAQGELHKKMAVEEKTGANRAEYSRWEALCRLLCGISPWLELEKIADPEEKALQEKLRGQALLAIAHQVNPASPDYARFEQLSQPFSQLLVDGAFLAQALLRAPRALAGELPKEAKENLVNAFLILRRIRPANNNWLLFSSQVEAGLKLLTGEYKAAPVTISINQMEDWYVGDGWYSDGPSFAFDYYNSLVIHPMLLDHCAAFPELIPPEKAAELEKRAIRCGRTLERLVAPDGSYVVVGRSSAYRCGVFHLLAQLASTHRLPEELTPAGVREALGAVLQKTLGETSYREDGFLHIGVAGAQPGLGEFYINTGSLYLCSTIFLPLGLSASDPFWKAPEERWTQQKIWSGMDYPADHSIG